MRNDPHCQTAATTMIKLLLLAAFVGVSLASSCIDCICNKESGCKPIGCNMDEGSLSCGYFQITLQYYIDCGTPGRNSGESIDTAWKRCADNKPCATTCVNNYTNRYKSGCSGKGTCETMARLHNGGPDGCNISDTKDHWKSIKKCCDCK